MESRSISIFHACKNVLRRLWLFVKMESAGFSAREPISFRQVLGQLKRDLIGKDSHRGVTLTYTWLANQFGHFSLGFIPSLIAAYFLRGSAGVMPPELRAALYVGGFWAFFEIFNFLGPLLAAGLGGKFMSFQPRYTFSPAWWNIGFDTLTDIMFFCFGAFSAAIFQQCYYVAPEAAVILALVLMPVSYYWYKTKMYLQFAEYPTQIRLGQWNNLISKKDKAAVQAFMEGGVAGQHLLVFGTKASGKTPLGIAIATELSIQHRSCLYISAMKLLSMFHDPSGGASGEGFWSWRKVSTLVIDDINPGAPIHDELIRPQTFARLLEHNPCGAINRAALRDANVIWVLGTDKADESFRRQWVELLRSLDIELRNIHCVNLSRKVRGSRRVISFKGGYDSRTQSLRGAAGF